MGWNNIPVESVARSWFMLHHSLLNLPQNCYRHHLFLHIQDLLNGSNTANTGGGTHGTACVDGQYGCLGMQTNGEPYGQVCRI